MSPNNENQKTPRNVDERIDALTANLETLSATANDIALSQKLQADMLVSLDANIEKLTANVDKLASRQGEYDARLDRLINAVEILARVSNDHQHRIENLEGDKPAQ